MILSVILMTTLFYKALILKGEFDADHTYALKGYLLWIGSAGKNKQVRPGVA